MKSKSVSRSFAIVMAAATVAPVILPTLARAQQGVLGADGCFYTAIMSAAPSAGQQGVVQIVRQGCIVQPDNAGQVENRYLGNGQPKGMDKPHSGSKVGKVFKALVATHKQVMQALQAYQIDAATMDPQGTQQGPDITPMAPQARQQGDFPQTTAQQVAQAAGPYVDNSYAVASGAKIASPQSNLPGKLLKGSEVHAASHPTVPPVSATSAITPRACRHGVK